MKRYEESEHRFKDWRWGVERVIACERRFTDWGEGHGEIRQI